MFDEQRQHMLVNDQYKEKQNLKENVFSIIPFDGQKSKEKKKKKKKKK